MLNKQELLGMTKFPEQQPSCRDYILELFSTFEKNLQNERLLIDNPYSEAYQSRLSQVTKVLNSGEAVEKLENFNDRPRLFGEYFKHYAVQQ